MYPEYSVLMSVYAKEQPKALHQSILSMLHQEIPPREIVIICDGPLTKGLNNVLLHLKEEHPLILKIHPLPTNQGLGHALKLGITLCKFEYILRMDTDDISVPQRSKLQLEAMKKNQSLVIVGGQIVEFDAETGTPYAEKKVPLSDSQIRKFALKRNPFNHMSVCYKKSAVLQAGNYKDMPLFEDYWLWMRLLEHGKGENLDHVLVHAAAGENMIKRRGGFKYLSPIWNFQKTLYINNFQSIFRCLFNCISRSIVALMPGSLRAAIYSLFLRNANSKQ